MGSDPKWSINALATILWKGRGEAAALMCFTKAMESGQWALFVFNTQLPNSL